MRYLFGFLCVCALGVMPMVGCDDAEGGGGSGGTGIPCEDDTDCDDDNRCTADVCDPADGTCSNPNEPENTACGLRAPTVCDGAGTCVECNRDAQCSDDFNDCTVQSCDSGNVCTSTPVANDTECAGGTCQSGACELTSTVLPCSEQGIRNAIAAGGDDPYTFDCNGPQTVVTQAEIVIDNDVILDGEGDLTVDGDSNHAVFGVVEGVVAELHGFGVTGGARPGTKGPSPGGCIANGGTLTVTNSTVSGGDGAVDSGIANSGTLTLTNSTVSGNLFGGISNDGTLTITNCTVSGNVELGGNFVNEGLGMVTMTNCTVSGIAVQDQTTMTVANSLVDGDCDFGQEGLITSNGHNIESPGNTCGFDQGTDQVDVTEGQLNVGPLQDNGGPTETHALLPGSVAIDVIPADMCEVDEDQRGVARPQGDACDVGAVEMEVTP